MSETANLGKGQNEIASFADSEYEVIDISITVNEKTACFPGDVPFSRSTTVSYNESGVINLTSFSMSPHIGTHADSPVHIKGDLDEDWGMAGDLPLSRFIGSCLVVDLSEFKGEIGKEQVLKACPNLNLNLNPNKNLPPRLLFKTMSAPDHTKFAEPYAYFASDLISWAAENRVVLLGIDTPSVDHTKSKSLEAHHQLLLQRISWLENLDLSKVEPGNYLLVALPLRFGNLEASPVRAVLLKRRVK